MAASVTKWIYAISVRRKSKVLATRGFFSTGCRGSSRLDALGLVLSLLTVLSGCAYLSSREQNLILADAISVRQRVEVIRELTFADPPAVRVESRAQAAAILARQISAADARRLQLAARVGALIGLYDPGVDLRHATLQAWREHVVGFYDSADSAMVLVHKPFGLANLELFPAIRQPPRTVLLAHEFTHALQDQNFALTRRLASLSNNDDRALALKSVAEGDATISGYACWWGAVDRAKLDQLVARYAALVTASRRGDSASLPGPLIFQYAYGVPFVAQAYRRGGWLAVDRLYRDPSLSTQELMHPQLYLRGATGSTITTPLEDWPDVPGWQRVYENTVGEYQLYRLLRRLAVPEEQTQTLSRAWAADRIGAFTHGSSGLSILWLIVFRDLASSRLFATVYRNALKRHLDLSIPFQLGEQGTAVEVAIGPGAAALMPEFHFPGGAVIRRKSLKGPDGREPGCDRDGAGGRAAVGEAREERSQLCCERAHLARTVGNFGTRSRSTTFSS